ncbi:hypothetical protein GGI43DRAFT_379059 [Trichoderma evansii]
MLELANTVHGSLAPAVPSLGNFTKDDNVIIYKIVKIDGINYSQLERSRSHEEKENFLIWQGEALKSVATFSAESWENPIRVEFSDAQLVLLSHQRRIENLRRSLPIRFHPLLSYCVDNIQAVFSSEIPWTLNHDDLCESNVMVNPTTGALTGYIDWAETAILPFSLAL